MTTKHVVADDAFGLVSRRTWELKRRILEGTLDPTSVAKELQDIAEGKHNVSSPFFAKEEVKARVRYGSQYEVRPVSRQIEILQRAFSWAELDLKTNHIPNVPLPAGAEGWFVAPKLAKISDHHGETVNKALEAFKRSGGKGISHYIFKNDLRLDDRTAAALVEFESTQRDSDFLIFPAQFGLRHAGRSTRRVHEVIAGTKEFCLDTFSVLCMLLTHPERLTQRSDLDITISGDNYIDTSRDPQSLQFQVTDGFISQSTVWIGSVDDHFASPTGFLV